MWNVTLKPSTYDSHAGPFQVTQLEDRLQK